MPSKKVLALLNQDFADAPIRSGDSVFTTAEYAQSVGISGRMARERIVKLIGLGKVRRVRTRRGDKLTAALEYIAK